MPTYKIEKKADFNKIMPKNGKMHENSYFLHKNFTFMSLYFGLSFWNKIIFVRVHPKYNLQCRSNSNSKVLLCEQLGSVHFKSIPILDFIKIFKHTFR